jgi:nitrate/nitrite transport system ATP-binding protein
MRPKLLLLDEPLSALDALTRSNIQGEILKLQEEAGISVLMITNDVDEALFMADRVIPLTPKGQESLGPTFHVDIPRPRHKAAMNDSPRYRELRAALTNYLLSQMPSESAAKALPPAVLERLKPAHAA